MTYRGSQSGARLAAVFPHVTQEGLGNRIAVFPCFSQLRIKPLEHSQIIGQQCLHLALVNFVQELIYGLECIKQPLSLKANSGRCGHDTGYTSPAV